MTLAVKVALNPNTTTTTSESFSLIKSLFFPTVSSVLSYRNAIPYLTFDYFIISNLTFCFFTGKFYANKIRYVAIEVNTTIKFRILGHEAGLPIRDEWEKFISEQVFIRK